MSKVVLKLNQHRHPEFISGSHGIPKQVRNDGSEVGYITLLSTLFLVAIGGMVAGSLILLGLGFSKTSFALDQSNQAKALANACAEEALQQISDSIPFEGTGSLTLGQGSCSYTVTKLTGQNRTATASGTVGTIIRKVSITLDKIRPSINITSWQEVADY